MSVPPDGDLRGLLSLCVESATLLLFLLARLLLAHQIKLGGLLFDLLILLIELAGLRRIRLNCCTCGESSKYDGQCGERCNKPVGPGSCLDTLCHQPIPGGLTEQGHNQARA